MIVYEPMLPIDILGLDMANLDRTSENFSFGYYMDYLLQHPYDFFTARYFDSAQYQTTTIISTPVVAYAFGKRELKEELCYHLSAVSVAPSARMLGVGRTLMKLFETTGNTYNAWFIDLFVRMANKGAISFYSKLGYVTYRKVFNYYWYPSDHALDMRLSLAKDTEKNLMKRSKDINAEDLVD